MGAYVEHRFKRGFLLDEERLRKLHEIIDSRTAKFPTPLSPVYKVYRGDSYSYETESVDTVATEDNEDWRAIAKLEILAHEPDVFDFELSFSDKGVIAEISGDDRDAVFLLFSDLREYIQEQVLIGRMLSNSSARVIGLMVTFTIIIVFSFFMMNSSLVTDLHSNPDLIEGALSTSDVQEKLNFLIEARKHKLPRISFYLWMASLMLLPIFIASDVPATVWRLVFPSNIFLFGKRKISFEKRRALVGRLFWTVIVGLGVSAIAGLAVWWFTAS